LKYLSFILLLIPIFTFAQKSIVIKGKITDELGDVIPARIRIQQIKKPQYFDYSDAKGNYTFRFKYKEDQKDGILFHSIWYQDISIKITKKEMRRLVGDTLYLNVKLPFAELKGPTIFLERPPDTAFGHPTIGVQDYEFDHDRYVLLGFEKTLKKGAEVMLATRDTIISRFPVPGEAVRLFKDYRKRIYVICKKKVFLCSFRNDVVAMSQVELKSFYVNNWMILDTLQGQYYFSNMNELYPAYEYFVQHFGDSVQTQLHHVEDQLIMDLYRAEYKYASGQEKLWAVRQEMASGIDKEIWMGAKYFTHSLYYKVPYAPLFVKEDTVLIFDHYQDLLFKFNSKNEKVDSIPIRYHKLTKPSKWEQPLLADESTEEIYGLFLKQGHYHLKKVNTQTGLTSLAFGLYYKFAEDIKIDKGYVYYIYRPYESAQERFIYREKIKLKQDNPNDLEDKSE